MAEDVIQIMALIRELYAFRNLVDDDLVKVAAFAEILDLAPDQIEETGEDAQSPFYMVVSGKVNLEFPDRPGRGEVLKRGEFFGADFLLYGKPRPTKAIALVTTQLLRLPSDKLAWLLNEIPGLKDGLKSVDDMTRWTHNSHFSFLGEDELVQLVVRKHPAYLLVSEVIPVLIGWLAAAFFLGALYVSMASFRLALEYTGSIVLASALLYGIWRWIDWGNDYYIVTDQRVIWLEQVVGLYDSRQESPLTAIKSDAINAPFLGRIFGYGNVIINAFMGQVIFRHVGDPNNVKTVIDKALKTAQTRQLHHDQATMEKIVRLKIEPPPAAEISGTAPDTSQSAGLKARKPARRPFRFSNLFKTRWEEGGVVTYRKHGFVLLYKIGGPTLIELLLIILMILLFSGAAKGTISAGLAATGFLVLILSMIGVFLWWLYQYLDWHNDIFQITSDNLVDSIKKPLGTEVTKSAPLSNVQSMDYTRRGLLGVLLNLGSVFINVGTETRLIFKDIADPARAQQDIFNRMYDNQRKKQLGEIAKQGDQITDWLAAYHRQAEDLRKSQNKPQNEENPG